MVRRHWSLGSGLALIGHFAHLTLKIHRQRNCVSFVLADHILARSALDIIAAMLTIAIVRTSCVIWRLETNEDEPATSNHKDRARFYYSAVKYTSAFVAEIKHNPLPFAILCIDTPPVVSYSAGLERVVFRPSM